MVHIKREEKKIKKKTTEEEEEEEEEEDRRKKKKEMPPRTPTMGMVGGVSASGGGGGGAGGRASGSFVRLLSSPLCVAALMSVAFFVYVFNWKNASSPSSIHHRNHHLSGRNNHLHQNRRFGERSAGMDHLAHSYRNQNDHEDETSYEEDEDVERRRADLAEEGGGERSDSRNNNKKKASASSSSLPKSSVSYPKAKKDGARLIAQS